jgi:arylsulfatase A-like enzyme
LTLAERLSLAGYRTGAIVANAGYLHRGMGWSRGFSYYSDEPNRLFGYVPSPGHTMLSWFPIPFARLTSPWLSAEEINRRAYEWLSVESEAPFFLFLNYMDTHGPYVPPEPWPDHYPGRLDFLLDPRHSVLRGERDLTPLEAGHYRALYDGAVSYVDSQIGDLLHHLVGWGLMDDTMVVVTSDHGEFFGEHRLFEHAIGPYEPVHRVPLLVRFPRGIRRGTVDHRVQLIDIVPTVLDALGLPVPNDLDGEVLPSITHPIVVEQAPNLLAGRRYGRGLGRGYRALYEQSWKLVAFDDESVLLFDLDSDPGEYHDQAASRPDRASAMHARLREFSAANRPQQASSPLSEEAAARLRAVGYLQ